MKKQTNFESEFVKLESTLRDKVEENKVGHISGHKLLIKIKVLKVQIQCLKEENLKLNDDLHQIQSKETQNVEVIRKVKKSKSERFKLVVSNVYIDKDKEKTASAGTGTENRDIENYKKEIEELKALLQEKENRIEKDKNQQTKGDF